MLYHQENNSGGVVTHAFIAGASSAPLGTMSGSSGPYMDFTDSLTLDRATTLVDAGSNTTGRISFSGAISGNVGTLSVQGGRVTLAGVAALGLAVWRRRNRHG